MNNENTQTADGKAKFQEATIAPMHTCEHIVNRTMVNMFGCGRSVSAHIERKKSKLDYRLPQALTEEEIKRVEDTVGYKPPPACNSRIYPYRRGS